MPNTCTHTHSYIQIEMKVSFGEQIFSFSSTLRKASAAAERFLQIVSLTLEQRGYFHQEWGSKVVAVFIRCSSVLKSVGGDFSGSQGAFSSFQ